MLHEIKCDGVKEVAIITDHGHKGGQDHFIIVLVWYGKDKNGNDVVKFFCPSIDYAGHTAKEAAMGMGVKRVYEQLFAGTDIKLIAATSDAGGGANIRNLHQSLMALGVWMIIACPTIVLYMVHKKPMKIL